MHNFKLLNTLSIMFQLSKKYPQKRAFITGAASGLGKAFCEALAKEGWTIGIADINEKQLQFTEQQIIQLGGKPIKFGLDVADSDNYKNAAAAFLQQCKGIDLLINNAGVGEGAPFEQYSIENWNWIVSINQMGVIHGCHYFIPTMIQQKSGHIINIASAAAFGSAPTMSPYNVTKAAVLSLSETLYVEMKPHGVHVSAVMPTFFKTNIATHGRGTAEEKEIGQYLVETSGIEPNYIAQKILQKAGNNKLYIVLPFQSKFIWLMKRLFPGIVIAFNVWVQKNKDTFRSRLKKKYERMKK